MSKTRRRQPLSAAAQQRALEREFERKQRVNRQEAIRQQAETLINEKAKEKPYSIDTPLSDDPVESGLLWWTGGTLDEYIPVAAYNDYQRQADLAAFALLAPFILNAEAIVLKKIQSLQWTLEGGRNLVRKWQDHILSFEGDWSQFAARWVRGYLECDNGCVAELIRGAPGWAVDEREQLTERGKAAIERGADAAWEIVDACVLDPIQCRPTQSREFPILYANKRTGAIHKLREYNFMRLLDMPSASERGRGVCAVSRAIWAAQEDRMILRYCMEKMSENPGAGILFANASETKMRTALESAQAERDARGVVYYKGLILIPVLNPEGTFSAEFINFSGLPDGFNRQEVYNICKEVVATAFGLDVLEFGSIGGGGLGSATQATVAAEKARGKGVGSICQMIERQFRYKLLPESLAFQFESQDVQEEMAKAMLDKVYFENATAYSMIVGARKAEQYLADMGAIPAEYLPEDLTPDETLTDTESQDEKEPVEALPETAEAGAPAQGQAERMHKQAELVTPRQGRLRPLTAKDAEITEEDSTRANRKWDLLMPEYAGLLDARVIK